MPTDITLSNNTITRPLVGTVVHADVDYAGGGLPMAYIDPVQIVGLVPMYSCSATEDCPNPIGGCCERLQVFAGNSTFDLTANIGTYENDINSFLVDISMYPANAGTTYATWELQECSGENTWTTIASLNGSTYGHYWALGSNTLNSSYTGIRLNWGKVYAAFGRGIYRVKVTTASRLITGCLVSAEFNLRPFDCEDAHQTFKLETYSTGQIGTIDRAGKVVSLCGFSPIVGDPKVNTGWYDSIRLKGFFGYETITEYIEVYNEWQNGKMEQARNEAVRGYQLITGWFEKELHDRLKVYGLMSDWRQMSDYNINNSDRNIRQLSVKPNGNYEPVYNDKLWFNKQQVKVKFQNGYQSLIKSICCPSIR